MLKLICTGGNRRTGGLFSYIRKGKFYIGYRHKPLSKVERYRFFNIRAAKNKRDYFYLKFIY